MIVNNVFSCYIFGSDNLTLQCAEIIVSRGHELIGLISSSEIIKSWCINNAIVHYENVEHFVKNRSEAQPDFIFSIINEDILPRLVLDIPKYYCINYHDSPLPKYAGLYATSHAILNNEKRHAISWHVMEELVDAGDLLQQPFFDIDKSDNAMTLNLKCYEHAINSFKLLIEQLSTNTCKPIKQNLNNRTYYGLKSRLPNLGFISWDTAWESIDRLCKAVVLGNYPNKLVSPKIILGNEIFIVKSYKSVKSNIQVRPGVITYISREKIQISTKTSDLVIFEILEVDGRKCAIDSLITKFNLKVNQSLPIIDNKLLTKLLNHSSVLPKIEKYWVNEYLSCKREEVSFLVKLENKLEIKQHKIPVFNISSLYVKKIKKLFPEREVCEVIFSMALIFLYRLNNYKNLSVLYYPAEYGFEDELSIFLSKYFPFTTKFTSNQSFDDACNIVFDKNADLRSHNTFLKDIFFRYPGLSKIIDNIDIGILITSRKESVCNSRKLNLYIGNDGDWFTFQSLVDIKCQPVSALYLKNINQNFWSFIKDILINTDKNIFEFSIINKTERNTLMQKWNNTDYFYDNKKLLHQYFEEQVINAPKSTALIYGNKLMTYESLNAKANKLGYYLRKKGVTSNDLVGILMGRSFEMVICILGVLKSGGAYIPIDPKSPVSRKLYILENSQARFLLVTDENVQENLDGYKNELINVNKVLLSDSETYTNLKILNTSNSIAYSIYTSGTTGFPKGVAVSHKAICNHMIWMQRKYGFSKNDIFLQKTPFTFDASIWEFFAPLLVGAKIVIAPNDAHLYPNILINLVQSHKVTVLQLVPTMLRELLNCVGFKRCVSLRYLFSGGEALLPKDIKVFFKHKPRLAKLHNLYGPTETTIQVLTNTCTRKDYENNLNIIGKPIHNTRVYILDDMRQLVPVGISGELYIAGDCLAAGYLNNKKLTQQKFVNNPFSSEKNSLLYKTGDLAKWLPDGNVEYLGRLDSQVKIRGFRIEINEIEANLVKITDIEQSIVSAEPNLDDTMSLSAYLILKEGSQLTIKKIRKFLENYLPEYMIPTNYFIVDKFIITPSGKIDRKLLPTTKMQLDSGIDYIAPTNDVEKILSNIWCAAFKFEKVGIYDDFFDLGGNSLLAMKIITSIENHLLVKLSIRALFEHSTICLLSEEIEKNYHEKSLSGTNLIKNCIVPIKSSGTKLPVFLIHPIGGSVFWYKLFEKYLDIEQPLYAIQDPGLDTNELLFDNIEEMANHYVQAMKTVQPEGPYFVGGASFGSTVAVEVAKQLQECGDNVAAIISLDGWAFYPSLQNDEQYFQDVMREQNHRILTKYIENNVYNSEFLLKLQSHREELLINYQIPLINADFILFKAQDLSEIFPYNAPMNWWEDYSSRSIEFHLVPGDHETMFYEPHIKFLTAKLSESLNSRHLSIEDEEIIF